MTATGSRMVNAVCPGPVFWLLGLAGIGKSTIAQTFAEVNFADEKLGAGFLCSRDFEDRSDIQKDFPSLAFQLAYRYSKFRKGFLPVLKANPDIGQNLDSFSGEVASLRLGFEEPGVTSPRLVGNTVQAPPRVSSG